MERQYVLFVIFISTKVVQCVDLTASACWPDAGYCISLYRHTSGIHWSQARTICNNEAQGDILDILDHRIQDHTETVLADMSGSSLVWTGGRRSSLDQWINLDGDLFDQVLINDTLHGGNCGVLHQPEADPLTYMTDNCDEVNGHHYVICHTNLSQADCASANVTWILDTCYLTAATDRTSWYEAQNLCRGYPEYNGYLLDNTEDHDRLSWIMETLKPDDQPAWFGIWRRYWTWAGGDMMSYFNWASGQGDMDNSGNCVVIQADGRWREEICSSGVTEHVLCVNRSMGLNSSTVRLRDPTDLLTSETSTVTTTDGPNSTRVPECPGETRANLDRSLYVGLGVGGLVVGLVALVVGVGLFIKSLGHKSEKCDACRTPASTTSTTYQKPDYTSSAPTNYECPDYTPTTLGTYEKPDYNPPVLATTYEDLSGTNTHMDVYLTISDDTNTPYEHVN